MIRAPRFLPKNSWPSLKGFNFTSPLSTISNRPNTPLDIDPSLRALLKDVDISLLNHKSQHRHVHRELEVLSTGVDEADVQHEATNEQDYVERKSPAAHFGSQGIGTVVLPFELQKSIDTLISGRLLTAVSRHFRLTVTQNQISISYATMRNDYFFQMKGILQNLNGKQSSM